MSRASPYNRSNILQRYLCIRTYDLVVYFHCLYWNFNNVCKQIMFVLLEERRPFVLQNIFFTSKFKFSACITMAIVPQWIEDRFYLVKQSPEKEHFLCVVDDNLIETCRRVYSLIIQVGSKYAHIKYSFQFLIDRLIDWTAKHFCKSFVSEKNIHNNWLFGIEKEEEAKCNRKHHIYETCTIASSFFYCHLVSIYKMKMMKQNWVTPTIHLLIRYNRL